MSANDANTAQLPSTEGTTGEESKVYVGNFTFASTAKDLRTINAKIGDVLEAQVILRGSNLLGYGFVTFKNEEEVAGVPAADGDMQGAVSLSSKRGGARGGRARDRTSIRGGRGARTGGRARRSADDPDALNDEPAATSEEAAQNGQTSVKAVVEAVEKNSYSAFRGSGAEAGEGGRGGRGRNARGRGRGEKRLPREKKERGEPSRTLVFIRNLPFTYDQGSIEELFKSHSLSFNSLSVPVWRYGPHKGQGRGYAFATVDSESTQSKVIETLNGVEIEIPGSSSTPAIAESTGEGTEGTSGAPAGPRKLKLAARQGYENEEKADIENGAETDEVAVTGKDGKESTADSVVIAN